VNFDQRLPSFGESSAQTILVKNLQQRSRKTNTLRNQEEGKMAKRYEARIFEDMVFFIDSLMSLVDPEIKKLNESKRKKIILKFFQWAGFITKKTDKRSGGVWRFSDKLYEAMERGRPRAGRDYASFVGYCLRRPHGLKWDRFCFLVCLVTIFSHEDKSFFSWLQAEIKTIKLGFKILPLHGLSGRRKVVAIDYALAALLLTQIDQCVRHCTSRLKHEAKRQRRREARKQRRLTDQNVTISSAGTELRTMVPTNSSEAVPTPERADTVDAVNKVGAFEGNA
jgi:hypothetical protein